MEGGGADGSQPACPFQHPSPPVPTHRPWHVTAPQPLRNALSLCYGTEGGHSPHAQDGQGS